MQFLIELISFSSSLSGVSLQGVRSLAVFSPHGPQSAWRFVVALRKGVFPYSWLDHGSKFEARSLPARSSFFKDSIESKCSKEDYEHGKSVWDAFHINSFKECTDLYVKTDVLLPSDIFNGYREECLASYGLDIIHYFTCPGLTIDAGF